MDPVRLQSRRKRLGLPCPFSIQRLRALPSPVFLLHWIEPEAVPYLYRLGESGAAWSNSLMQPRRSHSRSHSGEAVCNENKAAGRAHLPIGPVAAFVFRG